MPRLQILMAEDSPTDAALLLRALRQAGFEFDHQLVSNEADYLRHLHPDLDVILSDYRMPDFGGPRALELLQARGFEIPFIIVSGTIGEDMAVAAMRLGATDYLLKDRLGRLGPAITQAIEQSRLRKERRKTEKALSESEERFREVVQNIEEVFWMTDLEKNRMLFVSAGYEKIWQRTCASLYDSPGDWLEAIHPEDRERVVEAAKSKQAQGTYYEEYRIVRPDGSIRWISDRAFPVRNAAGAVYRVAGVANDITLRREAEEAIQGRLKSEERLRAVAASVPGCLYAFRLRPDGTVGFPYASPRFGDVLGVDPLAVTDDARLAFARVFGEDLEPLMASIRASAETLAPWDFTFRLQHPQKGLVWIEGGSIPLREADGSTLWHGFLHDVTERKQAEDRALKQAAMLDLAHDAIVVRDFHDGLISYWNKGAERLYGWTAEEAMGQNVGQLAFADPDQWEIISESLLAKEEWHGENRHEKKGGKKLIVSTRATLVRDARGEPKSVLIIDTDITEQKSLEARFLRAQRMESIGTLASGVAHDLNNILAPIMMSAPLLRRELSREQREEIVATVEMSANRGAQIVRQVLAFGRGLEGERCPRQMSALVKEIMKIMGETFPKNIAIESAIAENLWLVIGDATQLHQVLLNLCVNARDAMPEGGKLALRARNLDLDQSYASMLPGTKPGPHVLVEVNDTGSGIPPDVLERIFDPFFTTKAIGQGTGLGLSTVLGIIKSHGGYINVTSEVGEGTTFQIFLPAVCEQDVSAEAGLPPDLPVGRGEWVLVVDDEDEIRRSSRFALEVHGYHVLVAADGIEALAMFAQNATRIAVVLTDLMMPHMDGVSLIQALQRMNPQIPIIASTGLAQKTQWAQLQKMKISGILNKPYGVETLLISVRDALAPKPASSEALLE